MDVSKMIHRLKTYQNGVHGDFFMEVADLLTSLIVEKEPSAQSPAAMAGYGAKPLEVIGGMAIIVGQRHSECKECKWHPDVCEYCEINKLENERIEKEMAS